MYGGFNQAGNNRGPRVIYTQPVPQQSQQQRIAATKVYYLGDGQENRKRSKTYKGFSLTLLRVVRQNSTRE